VTIQLNQDQTKAVGQLVDGFFTRKSQGFTLTGEGGTGKTTCVMDAVGQMVEAGHKVLLAAPTNKAVKQMEKAAASHGFAEGSVKACTLAKALGLALLPSGEEKKIKKVGRCIISDYDVLVMD
jgi:RecG-like helicase